ncbi:hypothetical protein ACFGYC_01940 [Pasteurella multocida]
MDLSSLPSALGAIKDITNQVTLLKNLTSDIEKATEIQQAKGTALELTNIIIELQQKVMDMQIDFMTLMAEHHQLLESQNDKKNYQLYAFKTENILTKEILVYKYIGKDEVSHYCCPACFSQGKKSILQYRIIKRYNTRCEILECNICSQEYRVG